MRLLYRFLIWLGDWANGPSSKVGLDIPPERTPIQSLRAKQEARKLRADNDNHGF